MAENQDFTIWHAVCSTSRMDIAVTLAASRLVAQQRVLDITANNLANANTPGYRTERVLFSEWVDPQSGTQPTPGAPGLAYTQDRATYREYQQGTISQTGNPYDLAISGAGYFTVFTKNGPRLTRDGRFGPTPAGVLADDNGNPVLDVNGKPIRIPPTDTRVTIAADGTISTENGQVGRIGIVQPKNPMKLRAEGATDSIANTPTTPVPNPGIVQGAIEQSNVQPVIELTRMMDNMRQFQFVAQLVQAEDNRRQAVITKLSPTGAGP